MTRPATLAGSVHLWLVLLVSLVVLGGICDGIAHALPPPKPVEELFHDSDLVIEGQVTEVTPYRQWLTRFRSGELEGEGAIRGTELPDCEEGVLCCILNFPYQSTQVVIDGLYVAVIKIWEVFKGGPAHGLIFISFVRYHFREGQSTEGFWSERSYEPGERLLLYLKKVGPFYQAVWWNAVHTVQHQ